MSNTSKIIIGVLVVVVVGGGLWWWSMSQNSAQNGAISPSGSTAANTQQPNVVAASPSPAPAAPADNSNQAIQQEMASMNTQLDAASSDSANVNQSMSDQPVQQAQ